MFASHGIIQSIQRGAAGIVTDGLVLHLDAGNSASYPGTGTTWTDLSGNGYNGTLVNGPTYDSANGGSIVFDGSNDHVTYSSSVELNTGTAFSVESCFYVTSFAASYPVLFTIKANTVNPYFILYTGFASNTNSAGIAFGSTSGAPPTWEQYCTDEQLSVDTWYHFILTYNGSGQNTANNYKIYINNISKSFGLSYDFGTSENTNFIGRYGPGLYHHGKVSIARIYNKELSASEAETNFNAIKDRYGL